MLKNSDPITKVTILGAGNVASALAEAIESTGAGEIRQVYSRNLDHAAELCSRLRSARPIDSVADLSLDDDIYIVSLADDAVEKVIPRIPRNNKIWVHTSGSLDMDVLSAVSERIGVFYPLQTFSRDRKVDLSKVTLFTEGSTREVEDEIINFGSKIFKSIIHADSLTRSRMHVAAVFACNFTNYMWTIAYDLLAKHGIPFDVLSPLLHETLEKALTLPPRDGQTGPARRGDTRIIEAHASSLTPELEEIYRLLSGNIFKEYNGDK